MKYFFTLCSKIFDCSTADESANSKMSMIRINCFSVFQLTYMKRIRYWKFKHMPKKTNATSRVFVCNNFIPFGKDCDFLAKMSSYTNIGDRTEDHLHRQKLRSRRAAILDSKGICFDSGSLLGLKLCIDI